MSIFTQKFFFWGGDFRPFLISALKCFVFFKPQVKIFNFFKKSKIAMITFWIPTLNNVFILINQSQITNNINQNTLKSFWKTKFIIYIRNIAQLQIEKKLWHFEDDPLSVYFWGIIKIFTVISKPLVQGADFLSDIQFIQETYITPGINFDAYIHRDDKSFFLEVHIFLGIFFLKKKHVFCRSSIKNFSHGMWSRLCGSAVCASVRTPRKWLMFALHTCISPHTTIFSQICFLWPWPKEFETVSFLGSLFVCHFLNQLI